MTKLLKGERVVLAFLVTAGIVGAVVFFAHAALQEHNTAVLEQQARAAAQEAFEHARQTVSMGQTVSLTAEDTKQVASWATGTKEFTVSHAAIYGSLQEASAAEDLGNIIEAVPPKDVVGPIAGGDTDARLLVLEVSIHNIDAATYGENPYSFHIEGDVTLNCDAYRLASFSGSPIDAGPKQINFYTLAPGESGTYLVGFWIRADEDLDALTAGIGQSLGLYGTAPVSVELDIADETR